MLTAICVVFILGYLGIAFEHPLQINKAASALVTGVMCWSLYAMSSESLVTPNSIPGWFTEKMVAQGLDHSDHAQLSIEYLIDGQLYSTLAEISGILFFLLGAMTIVELVDAFQGFELVTKRVTATNKVRLLWIIGGMTFFMSSVLDNLTTTIVVITLLRKLVRDRGTRLLFVGIVVIAANAGGAWTVIGDVTTTMLWIKNKISTVEVMVRLFVPSAVCLLVPLVILSLVLRGNVEGSDSENDQMEKAITPAQQKLMLLCGLVGLTSVPVFKTFTHLPSVMGMMGSLGLIWIVSEVVHRRIEHEYTKSNTHILEVLKRVDSSAILFFLGILLAVGCLSATGLLTSAAISLERVVGNYTAIAVLIGLISSVVDNVPLTAAGIEMYHFEIDDPFWHLLAFCAGTGGSCLIIGSAAGVAAMGLERIDFLWYMRRIAPLALAGYLAGAVTVVLLQNYFMDQSTGHASTWMNQDSGILSPKNPSSPMEARRSQHLPEEIVTCSIVLSERWHGVGK